MELDVFLVLERPMLHIYIIYIFGADNLELAAYILYIYLERQIWSRKRNAISLLRKRLAPLKWGPGDLLFV